MCTVTWVLLLSGSSTLAINLAHSDEVAMWLDLCALVSVGDAAGPAWGGVAMRMAKLACEAVTAIGGCGCCVGVRAWACGSAGLGGLCNHGLLGRRIRSRTASACSCVCGGGDMGTTLWCTGWARGVVVASGTVVVPYAQAARLPPPSPLHIF
jgi:hypothetical protein